MPGPTQPWDQSEDPRESTVDLPRLDLSGLAEYFRGSSPLPEHEPAGLLEPLPEQEPAPDSRSPSMPRRVPRPSRLRHPYAEPDSPRQPPAVGAVEPPVSGAGLKSASSLDRGWSAQEAEAVAPNAISSDPIAPDPVVTDPVVTDPITPNPVAPDPVASDPVVTARRQPAAEPHAVPAPPSVAAPPAENMTALPAPDRLVAGAGTRGRSTTVGAERAPAGSLADLRSRLARLPDGHPSSLYDDGGRSRPVPIRLRQLELGLPAPDRELGTGIVPEIETEDVQLEPRRNRAEHAALEQALRKPAQAESAQAEPAQAEPTQAEQARAEPARPEFDTGQPDSSEPARLSGDLVADDPASDHSAADDPAPHDLAPRGPAPDDPAPHGAAPDAADASRPGRREWDNPYAGADNGRVLPGTPADLSLGPWQAGPPPRVTGLEGLSARGGNGHGHGHGNGHGNGSQQRTSQVESARPDRGRGEAARRDTEQHRIVEPGPADLRALVERTLTNSRVAEGRNVFGSYGSSGLTPAMQRLAAHLPFGGLAPGSEANSLKSPERFAAKLARLIARNPGRTAEDLAATISDVVRFAFAFDAADYIEGTWLVHRRLKSHGFELEIRRNRWESPEYKGIFTQWRDPAHHLPFEVQFHTTASWAVVHRTHDAYTQITDPATSPPERARLRARQVAAATAANPPPRWAEIGDFRLEPR